MWLGRQAPSAVLAAVGGTEVCPLECTPCTIVDSLGPGDTAVLAGSTAPTCERSSTPHP